MKKRFLKRTPKRKTLPPLTRAALILAILLSAIGGIKLTEPTKASTPSSGTINSTGAAVTWSGDKLTPLPPAANGEPTCSATDETATNCDSFKLTVNGTAAEWADKRIRVRFTWLQPGNDYDMVVRKETTGNTKLDGDGVGATGTFDATIGTSGNGTNTFEEVVISPKDSGANGTVYYIRALYFAVPVIVDQYQGRAEVFTVSNNLPTGNFTAPTYDNYQPPVGYPQRDNSGEPSIGVNHSTGNVMSMSRLRGNRTTFLDTTSPADPVTGVSWFSNTSPTIVTGLDPILFTDPATGRTIGGELSGNFTNGFISDDDLTSITASFQAATSVASIDHQTIGGGPPNPNVLGRQPRTGYPNLFYYAAQNIGYADVATSFDGGLTYDKAVPAYTIAQCNGLHGHIKVAPDGTVYLPNKNCGGKAAVVVSENNGLTWSVRPIPSSSAGDNDPSVGIGAGGRIYVGYTAGDKRPRVAVSDDKGLTWRDDYDLGLGVTPNNLTASVFPAAVGGDNSRAAIFFLATDSTNGGDATGDDATPPAFKGTWYPYIATTVDGGKSWKVVRADNDPLHAGTPNPVQQGVVCTNGTTCPGGPPDTRNLLDFNDIAVDSRGRVVAVYADGCNFDHPCINITDNSGDKASNQGSARLTIIRQRGGARLFAAFDQGGPTAPMLSPPAWVESNLRGNEVKWATPNDGGSPLKSYRIYRGARGQGEILIAEVNANIHSFSDRKVKGRTRDFYYHVTAVNALGESPMAAKTFALAKGE